MRAPAARSCSTPPRLDEVINLSHRVLVMYGGRIVRELDSASDEMTENVIMHAAARRRPGAPSDSSRHGRGVMSDVTLQTAAAPMRLGLSFARHRGLLTAILVFLLLFGVVNLVSPKPYSFFDFSYTSTGGGTLALAAIGETLVILTGGFDLSVGAVISLVNVTLASHMQACLGSEVGWGLAGLAIGAAMGAFNGVFVAVLRLQPIVVTLATMFIVQGITLLIMEQPGGQIPPDFSTLLTGSAIPNVLPAAIVILGDRAAGVEQRWHIRVSGRRFMLSAATKAPPPPPASRSSRANSRPIRWRG